MLPNPQHSYGGFVPCHSVPCCSRSCIPASLLLGQDLLAELCAAGPSPAHLSWIPALE